MRSTMAEHGGAMTDGGEARRMLYLGSKGVTAVSTRCRRARRSCWRAESRNEAREEEHVTGGATAALGGRARCARELRLLRLAELGGERSGERSAARQV